MAGCFYYLPQIDTNSGLSTSGSNIKLQKVKYPNICTAFLWALSIVHLSTGVGISTTVNIWLNYFTSTASVMINPTAFDSLSARACKIKHGKEKLECNINEIIISSLLLHGKTWRSESHIFHCVNHYWERKHKTKNVFKVFKIIIIGHFKMPFIALCSI